MFDEITPLVNALRGCLFIMGNCHAEENDEYTTAQNLLKQYEIKE